MILMGVLSAALVCGCASTARRGGETTRLTGSDVLEAADELRDQLATSEWLASRTTGEHLPVWLQPTELENRSSERLTRGQRLALVTRVLYEPGVLELLRERDIAVLMPPTDESALRPLLPPQDQARYDRLTARGQVYRPTEPTHLPSGRISSISRAAAVRGFGPADERKDVYLVDLTVSDAETREVVWTGSYTIARVASGLLID